MPTNSERGTSKKNANIKKYARVYDSVEGNVTIWYKDGASPDEGGFGRIVSAVRRAREMVDRTIHALQTQQNSDLVISVLRYHFGGRLSKSGKADATASGVKAAILEGILESFIEIRTGLAKNIVICFGKELEPHTRGESYTPKSDQSAKSMHPQMHLNLNIVYNHTDALARTIVHEASHYFAQMPGRITYQDEDGLDTVEPEVYAHDDAYREQDPKDATGCADSFAWAALSFGLGHLVRDPEEFSNELGSLQDL